MVFLGFSVKLREVNKKLKRRKFFRLRRDFYSGASISISAYPPSTEARWIRGIMEAISRVLFGVYARI